MGLCINLRRKDEIHNGLLFYEFPGMLPFILNINYQFIAKPFPMKKPEMKSDVYKIQKILNTDKLDTLLNSISQDTYDTYNKIMKNHQVIGIIFFNKLDQVIIHHLIMFCDHFNIRMFYLPSIREKIIGIDRKSKSYEKLVNILETEIEFELWDV
jgi:hypothetical protein